MANKVKDDTYLNEVYCNVEVLDDTYELPPVVSDIPLDHVTQARVHVTETPGHLAQTTALPQRRQTGRCCARTVRGAGVVGLIFILMMVASFISVFLVYKFEMKDVLDKQQPQQLTKEGNVPSCVLDLTEEHAFVSDYCHKEEAIIASPRSSIHNAFIRSFFQSDFPWTSNIWLGLIRNVTTGKWVWYNDHSEPSYTAWATHEPNGIRNNMSQDCGVFYGHSKFLWGDTSCSSMFTTLCEKECTSG